MQLFDYSTPTIMSLKKKKYKYPKRNEPTSDAVRMIHNLMISDSHKYRHIYKQLIAHRSHFSKSITKPAAIYYAYYLDNPEKFNHEPYNIVGHMMGAVHDAMLALAKLSGIKITEYLPMDSKLCVRNKDKILEALYKDGLRVKAFKYHHELDYLVHQSHKDSEDERERSTKRDQ